MTDLTTYRVTDGIDDVLAAQYNRVLDSAIRGELSNIQTLSANRTLTDADFALQVLSPTAARDVILPAVAATNHPFYIINASGSYALTVKNAGGSTIGTVAVSSSGSFASDGTAWHSFGGGGGGGVAPDITLALTHTASSKTPPVDADELPLLDSATSFSLKKLTWANIKAALNSVYMAYVAPGAVDGHVLTAASGAWTSAAPASGGGGDKYPMEARLTLETGVAVSTTDQTAKTSVYLTPYMGNQIATYSGTAWSALPLSADISLSLSGYTADKNYDIWVYNNAGTLTLDSTIWTNDTTRATALALQDGVYVKSGTTTRRYVGTIRITATTGQCEDSLVKRFVWNNYNKLSRKLKAIETTGDWTYTTTTWRIANGAAGNKVSCVVGVIENPVNIKVLSHSINNNKCDKYTGIGLDATDTDSSDLRTLGSVSGGEMQAGDANISYFGIGYHYFSWLEKSQATGTTQWFGTISPATPYLQSGMLGEVMG